ncbi:MAG: hypothetical protein HYT13_02420 [Candidatus Liptonbacteria bacterium]|nr:hypothetical protein [Candidatus Liptonbacteria bacterium]
MIIYLHGPDDYRREEKKKEIASEFKRKHSNLGIDHFDLSKEGELGRLEEFRKSQSIFEPLKFAILENVFEDEAPELKKELKAAAADENLTVLISERESPPEGLGKKILTQKFDYLSGSPWEAFIAAEAKKRGLKLTSRALSFIAAVYQGDTWRLITELDKMSFLSRPLIDRADLENLGLEITPNFWEMLRGLKSENLKQRFTSLETIFSENEPAGKVFNILAYQWPERLEAFANYDLLVKSGKLDYEEVFVDLVIK